MKQLLDDYKRRVHTVTDELKRLIDEGEDTATIARLTVKRSCYRTFIAELERIVPKTKYDTPDETQQGYKLTPQEIADQEVEDARRDRELKEALDRQDERDRLEAEGPRQPDWFKDEE